MLKMVNVKKVTMEGFKVNKDKREVEITDNSIFAGGNGKGKSTIADAIAWGLTGKLYEGNRNVNGEFLNQNSKKAVVEVVFVDENGVERTVKRSYTEASGMSLWVDGQKFSQKKLSGLIDTDTFLLAFNPLNFLGKRTSDARNTIFNLIDTSSVNEETVLNSLSDYDKDNLKGIDLTQSDKVVKELRKEKSEKERKRTMAEGYIAKNNEAIEKMVIPESKTPIDQNLIANLENKITGMVNNKPNLFKGYTELLNRKNEFEKNIAEMKAVKFDSSGILKLQNEKALLEVELKNTQDTTFTPENLISLEMEVQHLEKDSKRLAIENDNLRNKVVEIRGHYAFKEGETCPMCQQTINASAIENIKEFVAKEEKGYLESGVKNKATIEDLEKKLKGLAEKITSIKAENQKREKEFKEAKDKKIALLNEKIKAIQEKIDALKKEEETFEKDKLDKIKPIEDQITALNIGQAKKGVDEYEALVEAERVSLEKLKRENVDILNFNKEIEKMVQEKEKLSKDIEAYNAEIEAIDKDINSLQAFINSIASFNQTRIKLIEEIIKKHFNKVSFRVEKVDKETAEVKPCFEVLYDEKGIDTCSLSEQMKAGIEIAEMIKDILGIDYPLFMDNSESILEVNTSIKQIIRTIVADIPTIVPVYPNILKEVQEVTKDVILKAV